MTIKPNPKLEQWHYPRLIEVHYPARIADIRDRDRWVAAMMLDRRLKERTRLILTRLALHLNIKTGRCDPSVYLLAMEVGISGDHAERMIRLALTEAEKVGWIHRTHRHGGDAKKKSQTNLYVLTIPDDIATGLQSPVEPADDRTNCHERPDSRVPDDRTLQSEATGLCSQANSEVENSEENSEDLNTIDLSWEFDKEREVKEVKQVRGESNFPSNSNPAQPSTSTPPSSARPPSPHPTAEPGLAAALERLSNGVRGTGGDRQGQVHCSEDISLTAGSSDVASAMRWRQ